MSLRIAVIGCGRQAPKHISGLKSIENVEIICADINETAAKALADKENITWTTDIAGLMADTTVHAVDICTPLPSHTPLILDAIAHGKDFFVEKPLCATHAEAIAIANALQNSTQIGHVGYIYRHAPAFEYAANILLPNTRSTGISPILGKIQSATFRLGGPGGHQPWQHSATAGGGAINEMMVHMLDLAQHLIGDLCIPDTVTKHIIQKERTVHGSTLIADVEDWAGVHAHTIHDAVVSFQSDLLSPAFTQYVEIHGDKGSFMGSIQGDMPAYVSVQEDTFVSETIGTYTKGKNILSFQGRNLFIDQMQLFVDAIQTRQQPTPNTISSSVALLDLMEKIKTA